MAKTKRTVEDANAVEATTSGEVNSATTSGEVNSVAAAANNDSKLMTQGKLRHFANRLWTKIKEKYDVTFKEVSLSQDKKLIFTKVNGPNKEIDLRDYARLTDKNNFKHDVSADDVVILSNKHIGGNPDRNTSDNRSLGFRGLTNSSFVDGYVSELVIIVDSDAVVESSTTWKVWAIKKADVKERDVVKKLIHNDIQVNVKSFDDNGTTRKCVIIPINEGFSEEVYFIVRSQHTKCNVCTSIDPKYHPDVINMSSNQPPMTPGEVIDWNSNVNNNNTAIMYLRGRESIGSLHNKINKLSPDSGLYVKQEEVSASSIPNKVVKLGDDGKLDKNMLPSIAINDYITINEFSDDGLRGKTYENGDVVVVNNTGSSNHSKKYLCINKDDSATRNLTDAFIELNSKDGSVLSVNEKTGAVNLTLEATADELKLKITGAGGTTGAAETSVAIVTESDINSIIDGLRD